MKKTLLTLLMGILLLISIAYAQAKEINYVSNTSVTSNPSEARFRIDTLKYEPYPVNAGDSFDLWVKVENIGVAETTNARFELTTKYPFNPSDPIREYGTISGAGESESQNNHVVLKYRVKVADDAPIGINTIEFKASTGGFSPAIVTKTLPIEVGKTKTDFDIVMQGSTDQGTSFAIANIGANPATAVTVRFKDQDGFTIIGPRESIIGNLDKGDFTTVTFKVTPHNDAQTITLQISYTDAVDIRNTLEKTIPVDISPTFSTALRTGTKQLNQSTSNIKAWIYGLIGVVLGAVLITLIRRRRKKP